jgi:nitrate/nitrite-specific signal transduction histidine kinase
MARCDPEPFSETDMIWLECMADQVVIAIQHGLMTAQLQSLSIIEERGRIARDMHDGLAQVLGYLNLQLQTLEVLLKQGKLTNFQEELEQMRQAIQVANADVRENILSLRTTLANEKSLTSALDEYITEFGLQTSIEVSFKNEIEGDLNLSSVAEVQLVCILQEALANVRKHAHASHVNVLIEKCDEDILVKVVDDGQGFVAHTSKLSFGLQTMRERAQSVGGEFAVHSVPGQGTEIECRFPCLKPETLIQKSVALS